MNPVSQVILTGLAFVGINGVVAAESVARFSNKDRLAGTLESLSSEFLVWKSPSLGKPVPFFLKNVVDLSLNGTTPQINADHEATLTLTNGDTVRGQLIAISDDTITLDTWYAGRLNINRLMVSSVKIEAMSTFLYRGPQGLDGWTQSADPPAWSYANSGFVSGEAGSIAKDGILPDECAVTFDVAWKSDSIQLKVILFSDDATTDSPVSGFELSFQRGNIYFRSCKNPGYSGTANSQVLLENDKARIEIRASRKSGKVCLFVNDRIIEVWTDPDFAKSKSGSCLHFVSVKTLPMRISRIGVGQWDGLIEQLPEPRLGMIRRFGLQVQGDILQADPQETPKDDRMELANGDRLEGEVTSIQDGMIAVKTPLGDIKVPVGRFRTVALKKVDLERCIRRNGDIRAWFPDGSSIVFRLDGVAGDTLTGSSQNFGTAAFKIAAFNRIEFNIYDMELEDKRTAVEW